MPTKLDADSMAHPPDVDEHLQLVKYAGKQTGTNETVVTAEQLQTTPLFSSKLRRVFNGVSLASIHEASPQEAATSMEILPQYGLMGIRLETYGRTQAPAPSEAEDEAAREESKKGPGDGQQQQLPDEKDQLVYGNTNAPWSTFICGSQGSGKSHTLSCMLENALLMPSKTGKLTTPLTGLVLHYDKFTGVETGQLCEAAYLCSSGIPVRVLVSPSNYARMKKLYANLSGLPKDAKPPAVMPMRFLEKHLTIGMMKSLMAVGSEGNSPLYMEVVTKVLREMAEEGEQFSFSRFKYRLDSQQWLKGQAAPLKMRLRLLESFLDVDRSIGYYSFRRNSDAGEGSAAKDAWKFENGTLTIVDLSCPFVDESDACALFNICLSIFLEGRDQGGRIIALDEAHKFLTTRSREANNLTETMLSVIRQQRHLATRVIIATQEPTLSPSLLDLCNVTIVHRFTSPTWFQMLRNHLAGAVVGGSGEKSKTQGGGAEGVFAQIVSLKTGEALVFCPSAILDVEENLVPAPASESSDSSTVGEDEDDSDSSTGDPTPPPPPSSSSTEAGAGAGAGAGRIHLRELGPRYIRMKVRSRVTADGGRSILAQ
ncbi:hypothetical protein VTO42DRAFT_745 [Malbranchea cinnamomea]